MKEQNMNTITVRNIVIGEGIPKICIPIVGVTKKAILEEAKQATKLPLDLLEWRVDWYEDCFDIESVLETVTELRNLIEEIPLLFTFRTVKEGGEKEVSQQEYKQLLLSVIKAQQIDLIDIEFFSDKDVVSFLLEHAKQNHVKTILSSHDFQKTPSEKEIVKRLCDMQHLGCDITKIAVMPKNQKDVLVLLSATEQMHAIYADRPFIPMSMAAIGSISRIAGEIFGSCITFGAGKKSSAPGQIEAPKLKQVLEILHQSL